MGRRDLGTPVLAIRVLVRLALTAAAGAAGYLLLALLSPAAHAATPGPDTPVAILADAAGQVLDAHHADKPAPPEPATAAEKPPGEILRPTARHSGEVARTAAKHSDEAAHPATKHADKATRPATKHPDNAPRPATNDSDQVTHPATKHPDGARHPVANDSGGVARAAAKLSEGGSEPAGQAPAADDARASMPSSSARDAGTPTRATTPVDQIGAAAGALLGQPAAEAQVSAPQSAGSAPHPQVTAPTGQVDAVSDTPVAQAIEPAGRTTDADDTLIARVADRVVRTQPIEADPGSRLPADLDRAPASLIGEVVEPSSFEAVQPQETNLERGLPTEPSSGGVGGVKTVQQGETGIGPAPLGGLSDTPTGLIGDVLTTLPRDAVGQLENTPSPVLLLNAPTSLIDDVANLPLDAVRQFATGLVPGPLTDVATALPHDIVRQLTTDVLPSLLTNVVTALPLDVVRQLTTDVVPGLVSDVVTALPLGVVGELGAGLVSGLVQVPAVVVGVVADVVRSTGGGMADEGVGAGLVSSGDGAAPVAVVALTPGTIPPATGRGSIDLPVAASGPYAIGLPGGSGPLTRHRGSHGPGPGAPAGPGAPGQIPESPASGARSGGSDAPVAAALTPRAPSVSSSSCLVRAAGDRCGPSRLPDISHSPG